MIKKSSDGGPAFPGAYQWTNDGDRYEHAPDGRCVAPGGLVSVERPGMSLRAFFAAHALQAILTSDTLRRESQRGKSVRPAFELARTAWGMADAMLAAEDPNAEAPL